MTNTETTVESELHDLARLYGLQAVYDDATGQRRESPRESLIDVLQLLGAPVTCPAEIAPALRERRQAFWRRIVEPVVVVWDGGPAEVMLRLPWPHATGTLRYQLQLEGGESTHKDVSLEELPLLASVNIEGVAYASRRLLLGDRLPMGYHRLVVEIAGHEHETLLLSAPTRAYAPRGCGWLRDWGVFLPLYALHSERSWGAGDFGDLATLVEWTQSLGGGLVGTLPLLAASLDEPIEISPYSPVSRLFWNEFYIDVERLPEFSRVSQDDAIASKLTRERDALRAASLVQYRRQMALKRRVLEAAARLFFAEPSERLDLFTRYAAEHPYLHDYAAFRATVEKRRQVWTQWPSALREGSLQAGHYDDDAYRYHAWVQWVADEQLAAVSTAARSAGTGLYLDLPLGVDACGYDTWRERTSFALGVAGGAPPDPAFPKGQNWGFVPLHPEGIRETRYRYVRAFLRHQLRFAGVLRIDHMPSFHRVFWIPPGREPREGVYVRYPLDELYAVFSIESHRHRTLLVGEDLGTVPPEVPDAMARHGVHRMFVVEYEAKPDPGAALPPVPAESLACLNTHDMPPFAAYWQASDIAERVSHGLIDEEGARHESQAREKLRAALARFLQANEEPIPPQDAHHALESLLAYLRDSPARFVLVNLEDLWAESDPQNIPSTAGEVPNWRRKARYSFEEFCRLPQVVSTLRGLASAIRPPSNPFPEQR